MRKYILSSRWIATTGAIANPACHGRSNSSRTRSAIIEFRIEIPKLFGLH